MEYHEIGDRFEFDGVTLEVIKASGCRSCFFVGCHLMRCELKDKPKYCGIDTRNDNESISINQNILSPVWFFYHIMKRLAQVNDIIQIGRAHV